MKILYVITRSDVIGGASVHLIDLALGMITKGHEVRVLVGGKGIFYERLKDLNIDTISVKSLKRQINIYDDFNAYCSIKSEIISYSPDVVHLHSSKAGMLGRLASYKLGVPSVFTAHGWSFTEGVSKFSQVVYKSVERYMVRFSNKIITVSDFDKQLALKNNIGNNDLLVAIRNGVVDTPKPNLSTNSRSYVQLIMVARFDKQKNQKQLIEVLNTIRNHPFEMSFVGDGPLLSECKTLVFELNMSHKIKFLGARKDVGSLLAQSDVFLLVTNWEGLPLTILEAMSYSLPIIASDVGGVSETFDDGSEGFLVPRDGKNQLGSSLIKLITDEDMRVNFGNKARHKYLNEFLACRMIDSTEKIYFEVLNNV